MPGSLVPQRASGPTVPPLQSPGKGCWTPLPSASVAQPHRPGLGSHQLLFWHHPACYFTGTEYSG